MANTPTSKVIFGTETLIDLTGDTAEAGDVLLGKSFHLPSGAQGTGTLNPAFKEDIAGVESSSTASAAHASGTYLYYNNVLYKATADIAQGDSIVTSGASQNVEPVTVGGELVTLNTSLAQQGYLEVTIQSIAVGTYTTSSGITNIDKITSDMACVYFESSNAAAYLDINIATGNQQITVTGTIVGTTNLKMRFIKQRTS